jgi:hypothetical protein
MYCIEEDHEGIITKEMFDIVQEEKAERSNLNADGASKIFFAPLAQLDRVFDYESRGRGFESPRVHQIRQQILIEISAVLFLPKIP